MTRAELPPGDDEPAPTDPAAAAVAVVGPAGRMISPSKSAYRDRHPDHVVAFNSLLCLADGAGLWWGDLDRRSTSRGSPSSPAASSRSGGHARRARAQWTQQPAVSSAAMSARRAAGIGARLRPPGRGCLVGPALLPGEGDAGPQERDCRRSDVTGRHQRLQGSFHRCVGRHRPSCGIQQLIGNQEPVQREPEGASDRRVRGELGGLPTLDPSDGALIDPGLLGEIRLGTHLALALLYQERACGPELVLERIRVHGIKHSSDRTQRVPEILPFTVLRDLYTAPFPPNLPRSSEIRRSPGPGGRREALHRIPPVGVSRWKGRRPRWPDRQAAPRRGASARAVRPGSRQ